MEASEIVNVLSRWIHIMTAIVVVGGTLFMRFVLAPAAAQLPDAEHQRLKELVLARWKKVVMGGIALFVLSGFYNYIAVAIPKRHGDPLYHALIGIKILIALGVFFLASVLVGRSATFEPLRRERNKWLTVLIALALVIVLISSYLRVSRS